MADELLDIANLIYFFTIPSSDFCVTNTFARFARTLPTPSLALYLTLDL
jgi:hypothetical protein